MNTHNENRGGPELLRRLLQLVERRLEVVGDRAWYERDPSGHLQGLKDAAAELEAAVQSLPRDTDPMLRHYLERQSYLKAADWLREALEGGRSSQ